MMAAASASVFLFSRAANAQWSVEEKSIADLANAYSSGVITPTGVVQQYLDRIATFNSVPGGINSIASLNPNVMSEAALAESRIAGGATFSQYPLLGVPVLVKDSYDVAGLVTTNGVSVLNGAPTQGATTLYATTDAFSVARLRAAGAIILGKASQSTMAYSFNGIDNAHGVPLNPYQPQRQPGGSSSGTGAGRSAFRPTPTHWLA